MHSAFKNEEVKLVVQQWLTKLVANFKAGTDYGTTYSMAQPDAAAKNMMFTSVDSQQTCCEYAMNMFRGRAILPWNEPKIVSFQDEHKGIPCHRMLVQPSRGGSLCYKHFFSNSRTSCLWLLRRLCRRTRSIVCTGLYSSSNFQFGVVLGQMHH